HSACGAKKSDDLVFPRTASELNHVFSRCGNIVIIDRRCDDYAVGSFNSCTEFFRARLNVTLIRITERQLHLANVDPITIDFVLLQVRKGLLTHSAAIAIRVAAGADHKMLRHGVIVKANAERSTSKGQHQITESLTNKERILMQFCSCVPDFLSDSAFARKE